LALQAPVGVALMTKQYRAELSDFGWAVTWEGESQHEFKVRQAKRFCRGLAFHNSADAALAYWRATYLGGGDNDQAQAA
jgi:hypothetical protein